MTTLRDLSYMIEANTEGLNKAFPALDKLVTSLERLANSVEALNTKFVRNTKVAGDAVTKMGDDVVRSTDKIKAALEKQQAYMISAAQRMDVLKKAYKDAGQSAFAIQGTINAFQKLDKVSKDVNATTGEIAIARAKFNTSLQKSQQRLKELTDQQRALAEQEAKMKASTVGATKAQQAQEQAAAHAADQIAKGVEKVIRQQQLQEAMAARTSAKMVDAGQRQEAVLMGIQQKMNGLNTTVQKFGADNSIIDRNIAAFQELERVMRDANSTAGQQALARQKYNSVIEQSKLDLKAYIDAERQAQQAAKQTAAAQAAAANAMQQANAANAKNNEKQQATMDRNQGALIGARSKVTGVTSAVSKLGADPKLADAAVDAYQQLEKELTDITKTSAQVSKAKQEFTARIVEVVRSLKTYNEQTRAANQATKQTDSALLKQQNTLARSTIQFENLKHALENMGAHPGRIKQLTTAFEELSTSLESGTLDAKQLSQAVNKFNSEVAKVKRGEGFTTISDRMSDLASTAQVALGPLSGVASRITAITTLANRNSIAIAALVGGVVSFGVAMYKATLYGAEFEKQMAQINAILSVTGNAIGMTADEIEHVVERVAASVRSTESEVRDAAASLLTFRNVTKELYEGALLAAQGLAIIARGDINSQIRNIGRTLDDPINNLNSLTESGVSFNEIEKRKIELLQRSGDLAAAQAAIMERVKTVSEAAKGETTGLTGAWKKLNQNIENFLRGAGQGAALVERFTNIVDMLATKFEDLSSNAEFTKRLMDAFSITANILVGTVKFLVNNFELLISILGVFIGLRLISWALSFAKAMQGINNVLKGTILLQNAAAKGWPGLIMGLSLLVGIDTYLWATKTSDSATTLADSLALLQERLAKIKGNPEELERFGKASEKAVKALNDQATKGIKSPISAEELEKAFNLAEAGKLKEALALLEKVNYEVAKVVKGGRAMMQGELLQAANEFGVLAKKHLVVVQAQEDMAAETENVAAKTFLMTQALKREGDSAEQAAAKMDLLKMQIEANGSPQAAYITNLKKQIEMQTRELAIAGAVGDEARRLGDEQSSLESLMASGIITTAEYNRELQNLKVLGFSPLVQEITSLQKKLDDLKFETKMKEMRKELEQSVQLAQKQAELAGKSEYEQATAMKVLEHQIRMLNARIKEGSEEWNRQLELVKQLNELDFTASHREAVRTLQDEAAMQGVVMDNMFKSERTRERAIALAEKQNELMRKYGDVTTGAGKAELEFFKAIQQRQAEMQQWQDVADVISNAFQETEDALVEFAKTGEMAFDKLASSILEDIFRMTLRQTITQPLQDWLGGMMNGITGGAKGLSPLGAGTMSSPVPVYVTNVGGIGAGGADPWGGMRKVGDKVVKSLAGGRAPGSAGGVIGEVAGGIGGTSSDIGPMPSIDDLPTQVVDKLNEGLRKQAEELRTNLPTLVKDDVITRSFPPTMTKDDTAMPFVYDYGRQDSLDKFLAGPEIKSFETNIEKAGREIGEMAGQFKNIPDAIWEKSSGGAGDIFDVGRFGDPNWKPSEALMPLETSTASASAAVENLASSASASSSQIEQWTGWIKESATKHGIDPNTAVRLAQHEGLKEGVYQSNSYRGDIREPSYGPFQLLKGGPGTGYGKGLGNAFEQQTGLDVTDPSTVREQIDFAMARASKVGWGEWYGRGPAGISKWEGIGVSPKMTDNAALPEIGPIPQFKELNTQIAATNDSMMNLSGGFDGLTGKVAKFSDFDLDLKKFAGGRQSTNIEDLRNMGTMDWLKNEASVTKNTLFPQAGGMVDPTKFGLPNIPDAYNPAFQYDPSTFAGPTRDQFFQDIGWSSGGTGMTGGVMGNQFMGGGMMPQGTFQPFMGGMMGGGMGAEGGGFGALQGSVDNLNNSFTQLSDTVPSLTSNLTSGFDSLSSSASSLADGSIAKAATGLNTFSDQALTSAVTSQMQTTTQTTTMGLASAATSAQVTQLGAAASAASANMAVSGGGGVLGAVLHGGGIVGNGGGTALMSGRGFATAPRLHGGLHPNEFRAVLKRGEGVFTEPQMEALGDAVDRNGNPTGGNPNSAQSGLGNTSGGPVTIILQGVKDYDSFRKSESQLKASAASIGQRAQQRQG